ncbi:MAG: 16S rRNA (guanine(527)-N(7))-methyltransferase RsmG [Pseudomonadota bacterium]
MTKDARAEMDVSRETTARLEAFVDLLRKWNEKINLVGKSTLSDMWTRHIEDSLQLLPHVGAAHRILDLGSGGGLPAIPMAIALADSGGDHTVTLVESDRRKAEFLRTAIRTLSLNASVSSARIEDIPPQNAELCTARALAPCQKLFDLAHRHLGDGGRCLFLKGASAKDEVSAAQATWSFSHKAHPSLTDPAATLLEVRNLAPL